MKLDLRRGVVLGTAISAAAGQDCRQEGGNYYCDSVQAIAYSNFGTSGSYNRVTGMDSSGCQSTPQSYGGGMAPFDNEVS
jgi:Glycine-rich protein domain (DUF2403)